MKMMKGENSELKRHILVISQYFYPEQFRINDICTEWVKRGYRVTVITGIPNYPQGKYYEGYGLFKRRREIYNGIEIIRIPLIPRGNNVIMLVFNYLSFVISGFIWNLFTTINADYVFIFEVSPMTQALVGVWYAQKRNIPCYLYVQDLWPENVEIVGGIKNRVILNMIGKMVDYIYARCTKIFTTSKSFVKAINGRGVPLEKIEYLPQYAEDFYKPLPEANISEIPKDGAFNIIFTGNIGYAQGLGILPKAAALIKNKGVDRKIRINVVGDGRYKRELMQLVDSMGLNDMFNFIPKQPATRIPEFLSASDVAFLSLSDNPLFSMTIPAKLQSYMACGIPILASATGETAEIIKEARAGVCSIPGNEHDLAEKIIELSSMPKETLAQMGSNARIYYENHFDKEKLLNKLDLHFSK